MSRDTVGGMIVDTSRYDVKVAAILDRMATLPSHADTVQSTGNSLLTALAADYEQAMRDGIIQTASDGLDFVRGALGQWCEGWSDAAEERIRRGDVDR